MARIRPTIVYKITFDTENFQTVALKDATVDVNKHYFLDGSTKKDEWITPEVYCPNPEKEPGDFTMLHPSFLILRKRAKKLLRGFYYNAENLPVSSENETLTAVNFTECLNLFDRNNAEFERDPETNKIAAITKYAFHIRRFSESTVFKIPQRNGVDIFCYEGIKDPDQEFKHRVEKSKLRGLVFEKVWEGPSYWAR